MGKFSTKTQRAATRTPITTTTPTRTHEGGAGFHRDARSELFMLGISNLVGEDTFYEDARDRDNRYSKLIAAVTKTDPGWVREFLPWLRSSMYLRSAPVVGAAEYVAAGGPNGRSLVNAVLQRADEPAELLAYWLQTHGRNVPKPIKRGIADAVVRLYNERSALKYDSDRKAWRMGDVIELVHPKPKAQWQAELFRYLVDTGKGRDEVAVGESLDTIRARTSLYEVPVEQRRSLLHSTRLSEAAMTWESQAGWLQSAMDAEAWTSVIPEMGYMALLRNLRNFEEAQVPPEVLQSVAARIADPEQVAQSKQLPIRFLSAWASTNSMTFGPALEAACDAAVANAPSLSGRTLILLDLSGSMWGGSLSRRSTTYPYQVAGVFAVALARRAEAATLVGYGTNSKKLRVGKTTSILRTVDALESMGGTRTWNAVAEHWDGHDRVIILTDEQAHDSARSVMSIPAVYTFNLQGYVASHAEERPGWHTFGGGLTDASFRLLPILESQRNGLWPWELS